MLVYGRDTPLPYSVAGAWRAPPAFWSSQRVAIQGKTADMRCAWLAHSLLCGLVLFAGVRPGSAQTQDHQYSSADIETGSRLYTSECTLCHGPTGDGVAGVDLRRGQFRRPMSDEDLRRAITTGVPGAGMPAFALQPRELDGIVAYIRAGFDPAGTAVKVGDAARGRTLFEKKGACLTCHRVNGRGPRTAPDLSDVGALRSPAALQRSLLDPTSSMWPINRPIRIVTKDGKTIRGRRLNEDTFTVQLIDSEERLLSLVKADLREYELGKTSPMPSAAKTFTSDELADVVAYLLSLRGQ
jgi:putative heme-binding domain-containing protein